jgi:hypothetical protein
MSATDIRDAVPTWACPLDGHEYQHFMSCLDGYFRAKGARYETMDGLVKFVEDANGGFGDAVFDLSNLVQTCKANDPSEYQWIVEAHFDTFLSAIQFDREFEKQTASLEAIKNYLAVRIYDTDFVESSTGDIPVYRKLNESLYEVLVFDLPSVIKPVTQKYLGSWNAGIDELFAAGIQNVFANYEFKAEEHDFDGHKVFIVATDHFFAADVFYRLDGAKKLVGTYGSLISFPTRSIVFIHPIESRDVIFFAVRMTEVTESVYGDGPGSLSNRVFLYRDGLLEDVNATGFLLDGESARMISSPALLNLMGEIPEGG